MTRPVILAAVIPLAVVVALLAAVIVVTQKGGPADIAQTLGLIAVVGVGFVVALAVWALPIYIAQRRNQPMLWIVILVDLVFGLTIIGWVVALILALLPPRHPAVTLSRPGQPLVSPDGRYWWDGAQWRPLEQSPVQHLPGS